MSAVRSSATTRRPARKLIDGQWRPRQRDAQPMRRGVEHEVIVLEAPVFRTRAIIHAARREPCAPGGCVGIVDERIFQQPLRPAPADFSGQFRRGHRKAVLFEELHGYPAGNLAAAAADRQIQPLLGKIGLMVVDVEHDAQLTSVLFQRVQTRHQPQPADRGNGGQPHHGRAARLAPAVGVVGDDREKLRWCAG